MKGGLALCRVTLLGLLLLAQPSLAQPSLAQEVEEESERRAPEEMAREGVELLLRALRGFLQAVPHYGLPRIEENGDIVIPRLDGSRDGEEAPPPASDDKTGEEGIRT